MTETHEEKQIRFADMYFKDYMSLSWLRHPMKKMKLCIELMKLEEEIEDEEARP